MLPAAWGGIVTDTSVETRFDEDSTDAIPLKLAQEAGEISTAATAQLAVVKSLDNDGHWAGISRRLRLTGIDYCIVDLAQVQKASDLGNPQLLFLPNIELLKPSQLVALQEWMHQGGKVIVSGPMGNLSQPAVRNRLRVLFGAYWGFNLSQASTMETLPTEGEIQMESEELARTIQGGAVIPTSQDSSIAAIWNRDDNPPAVVTTEQSTFFGWRWGIDKVASAEVDSAWLLAALDRYDLNVQELNTATDESPPYCMPSQTPNTSASRRVADHGRVTQTGSNQLLRRLPANSEPRETLTSLQVSAMGQELENLIGRFESALLAANAANSGLDLPTVAAIEQFLVNNEKGNANLDKIQNATEIIAQAKAGLQNFQQAVAEQDYRGARQHWLQTRRTLWENYPTDRQLAQPEIRAIWLDRGTIVSTKSKKDLAKIFDKLAKAGFNTVFFETVNASYPIYPSQVAPEQNPLVKGWDPLEAAVELAHERGMELHAWVWIFAAANQLHNTVLEQPADYRGPILELNPDWAVVDKHGRLFHHHSKKAFLDPANPQVRRYLIALLDEIANRYEVDGIQLDYIRYPFQDPKVNQTYGYGQAAREQFEKLTGVDPIEVYPRDRVLWQKWTDFRIQQIDRFVATVSSHLRKKRPELILSAAVFAKPRAERLQRLQQNWEAWARRGDLDMIVPMTYAPDTNSLHNLAQPVLRQSSLSRALVLPGIRLLNLPDIIAVDQIQLLRDLPAGGYALFAVENLNVNLRKIFSRTQGRDEGSNAEPLPYRQPFPAAAVRYEALQREWNFLLTNNQIWIREPVLSEWGKQADALSESLNQLAAEPSLQNLAAAKALLLSFRSQFPKWMQEQGRMQPYQVQVWDNRLATIERLLHYGERTALNRGRLSLAQ
ncbi:MAG: family 10 glycosylhydrolase [Symploca sp. SIO2E9]|nr:family 10 glycosylhydrolase [Symploca sp. SIO2E9]